MKGLHAIRPGGVLEHWLRRRHGDTSGRTVLTYRRVYILPSPFGAAFTAMLGLMWLGAVNYNNNLTFVLAFLLGGLFIAAMHHVFFNLVGLRVKPIGASPVFRGDEAVFELVLDNDRRLPRLAIETCGEEDTEAFTVDVPARGGSVVRIARRATRRGPMPAGRITLSTRYPTALFRAWSWVAPDMTCLVYPAPEAGEVPTPESEGGRTRGSRHGSGDEDFAGLRRYRPGDPIRHIAWKATHARDPQVKVFAGETPERLWLRWDATAGLETERRLSRLCRWILDANAEGRVYGLVLPGVRIPPSSGATHHERCLSALALFDPAAVT